MDFKAVLLKYVDVKGLIVGWVMDSVVKPKLDAIVADSSNAFDDVLLAYVWPLLRAEVEKAVDKVST